MSHVVPGHLGTSRTVRGSPGHPGQWFCVTKESSCSICLSGKDAAQVGPAYCAMPITHPCQIKTKTSLWRMVVLIGKVAVGSCLA